MTATAYGPEADTRDLWPRLQLAADRLARIDGLRDVLRATEDRSEQLRRPDPAAQTVMRYAGGSAIRLDSPLQRLVRELLVAQAQILRTVAPARKIQLRVPQFAVFGPTVSRRRG